ncbi:hypothetical protein BWQ96_07418 [Gracilariopsis chorda]|uniref:Uncharacterized protein n=1 Tax=Gracilariopsis chorda TaxID=448386 RepID=A0A2V3IL67_9FLOR|nr:hypothetical protein BWQ96_07418 [Gracilariopsis chorda]|eukprot:PXF42824.1 hypothetical protein BWQ96_07418 [Gracilariopsis chorda]
MMRVMVIACTNGFMNKISLAYAQGTGLVEMDVKYIGTEWSTLVAVESRRRVHPFASGVIEEEPQASIVAYAVFLALSRAQGKINLNEYTMAYRNCAKLSLPSRDGEQWKEVLEVKGSQQ